MSMISNNNLQKLLRTKSYPLIIPYLARSDNGAHSAYAFTAFKVAVTVAACCFATSNCCFPASLSAAPKCLSSNYNTT